MSKKATEETKTSKKASSTKTTTAPKKVAAKKTASKAATSKKTTVSKTTAKKAPAKKITISPEYYDLPYRYNKTLVKILAQTPKRLFVYWDIADEDRARL